MDKTKVREMDITRFGWLSSIFMIDDMQLGINGRRFARHLDEWLDSEGEGVKSIYGDFTCYTDEETIEFLCCELLNAVQPYLKAHKGTLSERGCLVLLSDFIRLCKNILLNKSTDKCICIWCCRNFDMATCQCTDWNAYDYEYRINKELWEAYKKGSAPKGIIVKDDV